MLQRVDAFRDQVASHYRVRGYDVRVAPKVRGASGQVYAVDMVCDGPLGAILVSFGDAGGIDAAEVGRARVLARDIGASPVLAAPDFDPEITRAATQMGVALLDATAAAGILPPPTVEPVEMPDRVTPRSLDEDLRAHPWPRSGTVEGTTPGPLRTSEVDDLVAALERAPAPLVARIPSPAARTLWRAGGETLVDAPRAAMPSSRFSWLGGPPQPVQPTPSQTTAAREMPAAVHRIVEAIPTRQRHVVRWTLVAVCLLAIVVLARSGFFTA